MFQLKKKRSHEVLMTSLFLINPQIHITIIQEAPTNFISPDVGLILKSLLLDIKDQKILTVLPPIFNLPVPSQHLPEA